MKCTYVYTIDYPTVSNVHFLEKGTFFFNLHKCGERNFFPVQQAFSCDIKCTYVYAIDL